MPEYVSATIEHIRTELRKIIVGQEDPIEQILVAILAEGHALIEGVPGTAKTLTVKTLARIINAGFGRIQFTPDLMPSDITGTNVFNISTSNFNLRRGPVFTDILLADEINRTPPKTQAALLEAMEERQVSSDGQTRVLPDPFFVIATQNPTEQSGAYPLPESQLDRFLMCVELGYPDATAERELLAGGDRRSRLSHLAPLCDVATLLELQHRAAQIHVSPALLDYAQALIAKSRTGDRGAPGLSPRAGLYLLNAGRAWALLEQRAMVLPEDIQSVFESVAGHRLASDRRRGIPRAAELLQTVPIP